MMGKKTLRFDPIALGVIIITCSVYGSAAQKPIPPLDLEPAAGGGNPITITVSGVEQDPITVRPGWNSSDSCLAQIDCFLASWLDANTTAETEHVLALRDPAERSDLQKRLSKEPRILALNSAHFKSVRSWVWLGWVEYGSDRFILRVSEDEQGIRSSLTLPLKRAGSVWTQTDALAKETYVFAIIDRVARTVMERHRAR